MSDESKAIDAVASATGTAIEAVRDLRRDVTRYVGGSLDQVMGLLEDKLRYLRWERQIRLFERANRFLAERGLEQPTRPVSLPIAIPLIQAASLEENDEMQDRWAALLANAADESFDEDIRRAYISILKDLTPLDAVNLEQIYSLEPVSDIEVPIYTMFLPERVTEHQPESEDRRPQQLVEVSLANLDRLGLVTTAMTWGGVTIYVCVYRTMLGVSFVRAVTPPQSAN